MANELALSTDIATITAEINAYKRVAGEAIFEIGRRLKHVKENDLAHGEWERWCRDDAGLSPPTARKLITVHDELASSNRSTSNGIGLDALYLIATLPPEAREQPHTIPSTGVTKSVDEMTVRELREVKAELKRKEADLTVLAEQNETLRHTVESLAATPPEPPRIEVRPDPEVAERLSRYESQYGDIDDAQVRVDTRKNEVDVSAANFTEDVHTLLANYAHLATFRRSFVAISDTTYEEYSRSLDALHEFVTSMTRAIEKAPQSKIIDMEVIV